MGANVLICTVGHSTHTFTEFVALLAPQDIETVVDVRRFPASRRQPQFNQSNLATELRGIGITYEHLPELGGRRQVRPDSHNTAWRNESFRGYADHMESGDFKTGIEKLFATASASRVAIMCAEAVPWRCHRNLIADALLAKGAEVRHILGAGDVRKHELTKFARTVGDEVSYASLVQGFHWRRSPG